VAATRNYRQNGASGSPAVHGPDRA